MRDQVSMVLNPVIDGATLKALLRVVNKVWLSINSGNSTIAGLLDARIFGKVGSFGLTKDVH